MGPTCTIADAVESGNRVQRPEQIRIANLQRVEGLIDVLGTAAADEYGGDAGPVHGPRQGELCHGLSAEIGERLQSLKSALRFW